MFPVVAFQELCIAHTEHFLDRQALQLHRVGAGCYCRCIVCHNIPARQTELSHALIHRNDLTGHEVYNDHNELVRIRSESKAVLDSRRFKLLTRLAIPNHYAAESVLHLRKFLPRVGFYSEGGITEPILKALLDIEIYILNGTILTAAAAVAGVDCAKCFVLGIRVVHELCFFLSVEHNREVQVDAIPQVRAIVSLPVKECTEHISVRQIRARAAGCSTHGGSDLTGIIRKNQLIAMAIRVDVHALRFGVLCAKDLPQLVKDIACHTFADILRQRFNVPFQSFTGSAVCLAGCQMHRIVAIPKMVDELDQDTRFNTLAYRDESEQNIFHLLFIGAVAQRKVQVSGKHTGPHHQVSGKQFSIDRFLHKFLELGIVGFNLDTIANLRKNLIIFLEDIRVITRMQAFAQSLELFGMQCKALVLISVFQKFQQLTTFTALKVPEFRGFRKTHILVAHCCGQAQHIGRALEIPEACLFPPFGTRDNARHIQSKIFLAWNMLGFHAVHQLRCEINIMHQSIENAGRLVRRQRRMPGNALYGIAVDFLLITRRNLFHSRKMAAVQCRAKFCRVKVWLPFAASQIIEEVDNIQVHKVGFHRIVREIRPDGRSLRNCLAILRDTVIQRRPGLEEIIVFSLAAGIKEVSRHNIAVFHQFHVR